MTRPESGRPVLAGIRIVTMALNVPGPVAVRALADLGAGVTKIEPTAGDPLAQLAPAWYRALHAGFAIHALDLRDPDDRDRLEDQLSAADLLVTSQRRRALRSLDLHWQSLHGRHGQLCHVEIVGDASPDADRPGHDLTYLAEQGLLLPPGLPRTLLADLAGAERGAAGALALLLDRERFGNAGHVEIALADVAHDLATPLREGLTISGGALGGRSPGYRLYQVRDGYVALAALEQSFLDRVCALLQVGPTDHGAFERAFAERSRSEWVTWGRDNDIPIAAVSTDPTINKGC